MRLTIKIDTDNDAFQESGYASEIQDIMKVLVLRILNAGCSSMSEFHFNLYDTNGNAVGSAMQD